MHSWRLKVQCPGTRVYSTCGRRISRVIRVRANIFTSVINLLWCYFGIVYLLFAMYILVCSSLHILIKCSTNWSNKVCGLVVLLRMNQMVVWLPLPVWTGREVNVIWRCVFFHRLNWNNWNPLHLFRGGGFIRRWLSGSQLLIWGIITRSCLPAVWTAAKQRWFLTHVF